MSQCSHDGEDGDSQEQVLADVARRTEEAAGAPLPQTPQQLGS